MYWFILLFLSLVSFANVSPPKAGLYTCLEGNHESICDQSVVTFYSGNKLTRIRVEYVGECGSMGPYTYACDAESCEDPGILFSFQDDSHYVWENKQYGFRCLMERK